MNAAMHVRSMLSSCEVCIYRVSQVALHEASGRRHDVACDGSDVAPEKAYRGRLFVIVCESGSSKSTA
jgi:hypothetical protein